jgi:hypothetical protein
MDMMLMVLHLHHQEEMLVLHGNKLLHHQRLVVNG